MKVRLISTLSFYHIQKFDGVTLFGNLIISKLHFAETQGKILLFLKDRYAMINPLTEILSVKDTGSFAGLRNSLKITRYNTTTVFAWIAL